MLITKLIRYINTNYIISEYLSDTEILGYMDTVVDEINDRMQTRFPVFSEWASFVEDYNTAHAQDVDFVALDPLVYTAFPSNYQRSVVAPGTAVNFFTNDEEGEQVAGKFYFQYERNLSNMVRDYFNQVPTMYQQIDGGYVTTTYPGNTEMTTDVEGIVIRHGDFIL